LNLKSNLFCTDETKGSQDVTIANASDKAITVQVLPIHMVQQQELSERHFGIGVACDGQLGFQVGHGKAELKNYKTEVQNLTVYPHNVWNVQAPCNSLRKTKKGKGAMIENSIQIRVFLMDNNDAVSDEIGKGYLVGQSKQKIPKRKYSKHQIVNTQYVKMRKFCTFFFVLEKLRVNFYMNINLFQDSQCKIINRKVTSPECKAAYFCLKLLL